MKLIFNKDKANEESLRVVITLGILATVLSAIVVLPNGATVIIKSTLSISGIFCFLFILATGSSLKFRDNNKIADITLTNKFRGICYDMAIDTYGYNFVNIFAYLSAYLLGLRDYSEWDNKIWAGYAISGVLFLIICIVGIIAKNREFNKK